MRGQAQLETLRRRGYAPEMVHIATTPIARHFADNWPLYSPRFAQLQAEGNPRRADLRCVVGLWVQIDGEDRETVKAWADAAKDAGARRVVTSLADFSAPEEWKHSIVEMTDTDGVIVWPR